MRSGWMNKWLVPYSGALRSWWKFPKGEGLQVLEEDI